MKRAAGDRVDLAKRLMKSFVSVKLDCTDSADDEKLIGVMKKYDAMDLPTVRFIDSQGRLLDKPVLKGFVGPEAMLRLLKRIR